MFRRLVTDGLPGQPETRGQRMEWDFRLPEGGWVFELPMRSPGSARARPRRPEQAAWMAAQGFGEPDARGRHALSPDDLDRLIQLISPLSELPWAAWEALDAAHAHHHAGRLVEAEAAASEAVALAPRWDQPHRLRVTLRLFWLADKQGGLEAIEAAEGVLPAPELLQRRQAAALMEGEDWATYARLQRRLIGLVAHRPDHWEVLGLAWWAAGDLDTCIKCLSEGLSHHPGSRDLANRRAEALGAAGRGEEALAALDALLAEDPSHAKTRALRGWVRREVDPVGAEADYIEALALDPEQAVAQVGLGRLHLARAELPAARALLLPHRASSWSEGRAAWAAFLAAGGDDAHDHGHDHGHGHGHDHDHDHT